MTRFIMSLEEAVELVLFAFEHGKSGDIMVQKAPACTIADLATAVKELFGAKDATKIIGIRHGEKMYETLLTKEEAVKAEDLGGFYRVSADNRDLNYDKYFTHGDVDAKLISEYNSDNTERLSVAQVVQKLLQLDYIKEELANWKKS
jgi:UDP-glucose 4-epimerase